MRKISMREAVNEALHTAFNSDENVFTIGEDIGTYGGQLRCSYDLLDNFGGSRVRDTPISEIAIVGAGIGAALIGKRPVVELSYMDFIGVCFDQILNQAAKIRYMYGGRVNIPLVIRTQCGAGLGNGAQHSQSLEAILAHVPGIRVVMPSNAYDAKGLLLHAIRDNNPVVFVEHKALYKHNEVPEEPYEIDYCCDIKRKERMSPSLLTQYGRCLIKGSERKQRKNRGGGSGYPHVRASGYRDDRKSVKKTQHAVVVHELVKRRIRAGGSSRRFRNMLEALESPILRVAAPNVPVPFAVDLENPYLA